MRVRANLRASFESMVRAPPLQDWASAAPGSVHKVAFSTLAGMSMPTLFGEVPLSESRKGSADGFVGSEWGRASRDPPREAHRGGHRENIVIFKKTKLIFFENCIFAKNLEVLYDA